LLAVAFAFALCLVVQPANVRAQANRSVMERDAAIRKADEDREMDIKRLEMSKDARPDKSPDPRLALRMISEDFREMQIVNNEMMRATFPKGAPPALDYGRVSKATAEINRRALRLRTNLQFPSPQHDDARAAEAEIASDPQMRSSLLALDDLIMRFVNNPSFQKTGVLDAQQSAKAQRDLSAIIKLSQKIKQRADKLKG
jgi:hypothetical protein